MSWAAFLVGLPFGFLLVASRLTDYDVIHDGLLFRDPQIYLIMASAVGTGMLLLWLLERRRLHTLLGGPLKVRREPVQRKHIQGGILFGLGWAFAGTCPTVSTAMVGSGRLLGLAVMAGLFAGVLLRDMAAGRGSLSQPVQSQVGKPGA